MKKIKYILSLTFFCVSFSSCDLVQPGEIVNPNVVEDDFLNSANAMQTWVNGTEKDFAIGIGEYCQLMEILSDNYYNNYSRSSNVFDSPLLLPTDDDIKKLQRYIGNMRESANYGFSTVAKYDKNFTNEEKFKLYYIKAYSFILAGESFTGLPVEDGGEAKSWQEHLQLAIHTLDEAISFAGTNAEKAFIHTLKARVYYRLSDSENAISEAKEALSLDAEFCQQITFDGENGVANSAQEAIWGTWFQPLPRLDFLDPKYFQVKATDQCAINIGKAEEDYLILAEASLAQENLRDARNYLKELIGLVKNRPVKVGLDDHLEGRYNGGTKHYPMGTDYVVASSEGTSYRSCLILERSAPNLINVPYISGTSVTDKMIDDAQDVTGLLQIVYLMRQEIFIAEGRRAADLGIRLPLCDVEYAHTPSSESFTNAVIPEFIPKDGKMDEFTVDEATKKITITYDMNKVIVENRKSTAVVPFF